MGLSDVLVNAATLLADCSTFRTLVGAADRDAALESIYYFAAPHPAGEDYTVAEIQALRPFAVLHDAPYERPYLGVGLSGEVGSVTILIEEAVANLGAADSEDETVLWAWLATVDALIDELAEKRHTQPATGNYLAADSVIHNQEEPDSFGRTPLNERASNGDFVGVKIKLTFGAN